MVSKARILVIDDEAGLLRVVERLLEPEHEVAGLEHPHGAVDLAVAFRPDLAIIDIVMPDVNGYELMSQLKAAVPDVDVILMTGAASEPDDALLRALNDNAFYFIQKPFDRETLRALVARCLERRALIEDNRAARRLRAEIDEARRLQNVLLPPATAQIEAVHLVCRYTPCSEVGGDFFDYAHAADGVAAFLVTDAAGHGLSAAMLTAVAKIAFHSSQVDGYNPETVVWRLHQNMRHFGPDKFITAFAGRIAMSERRIEYVNAGHQPALLWGRKWPPELLATTGPMISPAIPEPQWLRRSLPIGEGDRLLVYTDGVAEPLASETDPGGLERLNAIVARHHDGDARLLDALIEASAEAARGRAMLDDKTALAIRIR